MRASFFLGQVVLEQIGLQVAGSLSSSSSTQSSRSGLLQRFPGNRPPTLRRGALGGNSLQRFPPKLPLYTGGVETPLIYRVSFNSPYILITLFLHDINPVWAL